MSDCVRMDEAMAWESPGPNSRVFGLMFERDITPTTNLAAGFVRIPEGAEQPKLSRHEGEEIYLVIQGSGRFDRGDRVDEAEARTAVYVRPFDPHRWINTGTGDLLLYYVNTPPAFGRVGGWHDIVDTWTRLR